MWVEGPHVPDVPAKEREGRIWQGMAAAAVAQADATRATTRSAGRAAAAWPSGGDGGCRCGAPFVAGCITPHPSQV